MLASLQARARDLKAETYSLYLAARDPRTPWAARLIVLLTVAYAVSPIDLIPDFVPVLGYLDDLIIVPAGIALALRLIPPQVILDARTQARQQPPGSLNALGLGIIVLIWIVALILVLAWLRPILRLHI